MGRYFATLTLRGMHVIVRVIFIPFGCPLSYQSYQNSYMTLAEKKSGNPLGQRSLTGYSSEVSKSWTQLSNYATTTTAWLWNVEKHKLTQGGGKCILRQLCWRAVWQCLSGSGCLFLRSCVSNFVICQFLKKRPERSTCILEDVCLCIIAYSDKNTGNINGRWKFWFPM